MSLFRTVGARLSLALLAVVAVALGLVYLIVVPSLQNRLVDAKLAQLERAAPPIAERYPRSQIPQDFADNASIKTGSRVVVLELLTPQPPLLAVAVDSREGAPTADSSTLQNDRVALRAALLGRRVQGTVDRGGDRYAEVAVPLRGVGAVVLFSAPLHGALEDVDLVERRLLIAGVLGLVVALSIGYAAARVFARRIKRLERAANRIASGRFDEPVGDDSRDELGELSRAFDRMRVQLAGLDRARREFVANASHELRTPLFALDGFLELFEDEDLDEATRREFHETMGEQVRRLMRLTENLLDLSRLDAGRMHLEIEDLDLGAIAEAAVNEFTGVAKSTDHPLQFVRNGAVRARGDEQRVLQIARILLDNALSHTPRGTTVRISVDVADAPSLVVADLGPGIDPEEAAQIFTRFYRGTGTKASGSGLGLAIAAELAQTMHGELTLQQPDEGSRFVLRLPPV